GGGNSCEPQLRQKFSPGAAGVPHFGHKVALRVGSLMQKSLCFAASNAVGRCFYLEMKLKSTNFVDWSATVSVPNMTNEDACAPAGSHCTEFTAELTFLHDKQESFSSRRCAKRFLPRRVAGGLRRKPGSPPAEPVDEGISRSRRTCLQNARLASRENQTLR